LDLYELETLTESLIRRNMKTSHMLTLLGILLAVLLLGLWGSRRVSEGFQNPPECTYSDVIPGQFLLGCANNLSTPFVCEAYTTFEAAKAACNTNPNCRGIVKSTSPVGPEGDMYTIRTGGVGATNYDNLETLKRDLLGPNPNESAYLITNLTQCKPNTRASTITTTDQTVGARFRQAAPTMTAPPGGPPGGIPSGPPGGIPSGPPGGFPGGQMPSFQMSEGTVTVPAGTLISVPAGDTIYARRGTSQGVMESQPAGVTPPGGLPPRQAPTAPALTVTEFTVDEAAGVAGLPSSLQLKVVNAVRQGQRLRDVLTSAELDLLAQVNTRPSSSVTGALASTPSNALNSTPSGNLTGADLIAIQQAAAAGAAEVVG
jgi:hypothetical protein